MVAKWAENSSLEGKPIRSRIKGDKNYDEFEKSERKHGLQKF